MTNCRTFRQCLWQRWQ